jgi:hypothetical protein
MRYSRHYYDLARMAHAPVRAAALADTGLLAEVVAFKQRFYPRSWARYDLAVPGSLRLCVVMKTDDGGDRLPSDARHDLRPSAFFCRHYFDPATPRRRDQSREIERESLDKHFHTD